MSIIRSLTFPVASLALAALFTFGIAAQAQQSEETVVRRHITVGQGDIAAAGGVKNNYYHVMAANLPGAREAAMKLNGESDKRLARTLPNAVTVPRTPNALTAPYFYPADLAKGTGAALKTVVSHAVYVDYTGTIAANWGNPEGFLTDLGKSTFIHLADQFAGTTASGRYTVGANASVTYGFYGNTLYEHELWAIVHAVAKTDGAGLGHMYHIFLPNGVDTCFDQSTSCYSPDNTNNFYFCAYHSSVTFSDIGTVIFSVEPYQLTPGCQVATPSPNSQLADSTNSVLSHEFFEAITDPIVGSGWVNHTGTPMGGSEIGDECHTLGDANGNNLAPTFLINGKKYEVQTEYSNTYHACAVQP